MTASRILRGALLVAGAVLFTTPALAQTTYRIESLGVYGQCLDIPDGNGDNKVEAQIFSCHTGNNQRWLFTIVDHVNGWGTLRNVATGKCLDVRANDMYPGAVVQQYTCHGNDNQLWRRSDFTSSVLQVKHSGLCVGPIGTTNRSRIRTGTCDYSHSPPYTWMQWAWNQFI